MMGHVFHVISLHCAPHKITRGSSLLMEKSKVEESPWLEKQTSKKEKKKKTGSKKKERKKERKSTILWQLCSLLCCPPQRSTERLRLKKKCLQWVTFLEKSCSILIDARKSHWFVVSGGEMLS